MVSLAYAVEHEDIDFLTEMLDDPAELSLIEHTEPIGGMMVEMTPLCIAVYNSRYSMARLLLRRGANVDGCYNETIMKIHNDDLIDEFLIGGKPRTQTPLATAVQNMDVDMVLLLLDAAVDVNNTQSSLGMTALWFVYCDTISSATDMNYSEYRGITRIVRNGLAMIGLLVDRGADVNIRDIDGKSLLTFAAENDRSIGMMERLIRHGANVNTKDNNGYTPLHYAALRAGTSNETVPNNTYTDMIQLLVESGAVVDLQDNSGDTPLHSAAEVDARSGAQALIDCGAEIDIQDDEGCTPLHYAAEYSLGIVNMLIDKKADLNFQDNRGRSPLHYAIERGREAIITVLILSKANLDIKDVDGRTPLHYIVIKNFYGIAPCTRMLIEYGADVFAKDRDEQTPTDIGPTPSDIGNDRGSACKIIQDEQMRIERFEAFAMAQVDRSSDGSRPPEDSVASWLDPDTLRKVWSHV
jgi:ankyrin repeat protein